MRLLIPLMMVLLSGCQQAPPAPPQAQPQPQRPLLPQPPRPAAPASASSVPAEIVCPENPAEMPRQERIRRCFDFSSRYLNNIYQRALRDNRNLEGAVTFRITTTPEGKVAAVAVDKSALDIADLIPKLQAFIQKINFGKSLGGDTFTYTLNFYRN